MMPNSHKPSDRVTIETKAGIVSFNPLIGNLRDVTFTFGDRKIAPLHAAHWLDDPAIRDVETIPILERRLAGDFFCAPFGESDIEDAPLHGWSAQGPWHLLSRETDRLTCRFTKLVMGASIEKHIRLAPDAPLLYQVHLVTDGTSALPVAHHPMIRLQGKGWFSCSKKRLAVTPDIPLDAGRNRLACPAHSRELASFPTADGGTLDLGVLPIADRHEDFVTLIEFEGNKLGWSAVVREEEDDVFFVLKDPRVLPVTMLWHSNGGRDYAPWDGRHTGVLGIEDGCSAGSSGHRAALGDNPVLRAGVPTALKLAKGRVHRIAHAMGVIPRPKKWKKITAIHLIRNKLTLTEANGEQRQLPFNPNLFEDSQ